MIQKATLDFLRDLKKNNNRDWFEKNKQRYLDSVANVSELISEMLKTLTKQDKRFGSLTPKDCLFRIYRDVRFSKDKSPYKVNMGASINIGGKKAMTSAGYYLHVQPGGSFLAGGIWMPSGDLLKKIRQEIDYNGKDLKKIMANKNFKSYFGSLDDTYKLKSAPRGYDKDHPDIELLKFNSYIVWKQYSDKKVNEKAFVKELDKGMKIMKPFIDFLNVAIS